MKVSLWGTRGSVGRAGPETVIYGGDTSAVEVQSRNGEVLILDGGSGIVRLGAALSGTMHRVDILLTHLHLDHIQGLGFFGPMFDPKCDVHVWGPVSSRMHLAQRLTKYLSPPLFPVRLRELPSIYLHDLEPGTCWIGPFSINADLVCHPGPTLGFRIQEGSDTVAYLPDHEPALGVASFPEGPEWTSGYELAQGVDLLLHDFQYTDDEYTDRIGWGHSSFQQALAFAELAGVDTMVTYHHDPEHSDAMLQAVLIEVMTQRELPFRLVPGTAGTTFEL
ncbi:MAG: MBL fold metallo-hydrolase [Acidimicrobiia bacterium]